MDLAINAPIKCPQIKEVGIEISDKRSKKALSKSQTSRNEPLDLAY